MFFFFNDTATTEIYTLSLHDALPISFSFGIRTLSETPSGESIRASTSGPSDSCGITSARTKLVTSSRSEEHTSELQSRQYLVCRLLLEKKKLDPSRTLLKSTHPYLTV